MPMAFGWVERPGFFLEDDTGNLALGKLQCEGKSARSSSDNGDWRVA